MRLFFAALLLTSATLLSASTLPISDPVGNRVLDPEIPLDALLQAGAWYGIVDENTAADLVCYGDICAPLWEPWPEPEAIYPAPYHPPVPKGVNEVPEPRWTIVVLVGLMAMMFWRFSRRSRLSDAGGVRANEAGRS